jgi:cyclic pyranopterin phosphate synthase
MPLTKSRAPQKSSQLSQQLTHFNASGAAHMVDTSSKDETHRVAIAEGEIHMKASTLRIIKSGTAKKGDVLGISRIAAIQAAKKTSDLIPLAHPIEITRIQVEFKINSARSIVTARVLAETVGRTGVEMEALCGVSGALLTIYDMCKAVDRDMTIGKVRLIEKKGGKSGHYLRTQSR